MEQDGTNTLTQIKSVPQEEAPVVVQPKHVDNRVYNAMKHGKYAKVPLLCNRCHHRAKDVGGSGKCHAYEKDSVCNIREEIHGLIEQYDTRNPKVLSGIVQELIYMFFERVAFAEIQAQFDGNLLDRAMIAQANSLRSFIKLQQELSGSHSITATEVTDSGDFGSMFRSIMVKGSG